MNKYKKILFIILFIFSISNTLSKSEIVSSLLKKFNIFSYVYNDYTLTYRLFIPDRFNDETDYPLIICLHGAGERGNADKPVKEYELGIMWARKESQIKNPCFILVPLCPKKKLWVNTDFNKGSYNIDEVPISNELISIRNLIQDLVEKYPIDIKKIYIIGISIGAFGVWDMIIRFPDLFAAAVPLSGAGDPAKASRINHIPIWNFHGEWDFYVPVKGSRQMINALEKTGCSFVHTKKISKKRLKRIIEEGAIHLYTEFSMTWHVIWKKAFSNELLRYWLFHQVKH